MFNLLEKLMLIETLQKRLLHIYFVHMIFVTHLFANYLTTDTCALGPDHGLKSSKNSSIHIIQLFKYPPTQQTVCMHGTLRRDTSRQSWIVLNVWALSTSASAEIDFSSPN